MLWTVKKAAKFLGMEPHQVYYLLAIGEIESIKIGRAWRLEPESVEDYAKRFPGKTNRKPAGNFIYTGGSEFLFCTLHDDLQANTNRKPAGLERRRRPLVYSPKRSKTVLLEKHTLTAQLELFAM
jgi:excisionase family DNA binding protein